MITAKFGYFIQCFYLENAIMFVHFRLLLFIPYQYKSQGAIEYLMLGSLLLCLQTVCQNYKVIAQIKSCQCSTVLSGMDIKQLILFYLILSQFNHNSTQPNITKVGFDMKMTLHHPPPTTTTENSETIKRCQ